MPTQPVARQVVGFVSHLRNNDFVLGPGETASALAVMRGAVPSVGAVRRRLKIALASRPAEWRRFDALFDEYWLDRGQRLPTGEAVGARVSAKPGDGLDPTFPGGAGGETGGTPSAAAPAMAEEGTPAASSAAAYESMAQVDFADLADPVEIAEAEEAARRLAEAIRRRVSRRVRAAQHGSRLDLRRVIRASLARGGEPVDLSYRRRTEELPRLVAFLDVSGSMRPYTRFLLQFAKGLAGQSLEVDVFLAHTRLVKATEALREPDPAIAMDRLARLAQGFGGGTRLGLCLRQFNEAHAKRILGRRTMVLVMSDGYDSGPSDRLGHELARFARRTRRVLWLNPLAGRPGYQPVALAMLAALPHIDHFAPANTLAALAAIEPELRRL